MTQSPEAESGRAGLRRAVEFAHRELGLDVAYVAELTNGEQRYRAVAGDARGFNITLDAAGAAADTYCRRLAARAIPALIRDARTDARVADLLVTRDVPIRAYVGVPLRLSDGTLYGTLCCLGHQPNEAIGERHVELLSVLGALMVDDLDELRRQEDLRGQLVGLIEGEAVDVAYQPIFDVLGHRCLGIEALARFPEPFARPDLTVAAAEKMGLGLALERLVVSRAWDLLARLGPDQFLAVNVSPGALLEFARTANRRPDVSMINLVVEVTEHSAVENYSALRSELSPLRRRGLRIAVDDAGAGYASLRHILELRPDFIKLDRWLIHGLADDCAKRVAVGAFVALARELGSSVVGEGVERSVDLAAARELGLDAVQGYLLGRPMTDRAAVSQWCEARLSHSVCPASTRLSQTSAGRPDSRGGRETTTWHSDRRAAAL
jgi:EAL domain-containing protein (putative c-di-GMP-specific phosphodiesterase class I)